MSAAVKIGGFLLALVGVFGVSYLTGTQASTLLAPVDTQPHDYSLTGLSAQVDGFTVADAGSASERRAGRQDVTVAITGPDGGPLDALDPIDGEIMHLIAYRDDLTGYQHVTPTRDAAGRWTAALTLTPGPWRLVYDFQPSSVGREITLGLPLTVAGDHRPVPLPGPTAVVELDPYRVTIDQALSVRRDGTVTLTVDRAGRPVTDLGTLYGSLGHGVLVRPADGGFLHLHTDLTGGGTGPEIVFTGGVPEPGTYRGFFELEHDQQIVVVETTLEVS